MSREQNERLTRVGPGQPAGRLLRCYWQPVALVDEFDTARIGQRPVKAVRLLGQDLVLFRDDEGRWGLLDRDCPHRGADLAYGRREDGGLRCPFHGWLFDVDGRCLDTPGEPEGSRLCDRVSQRAYPVAVRAGAVWAYLGDGAPPAFPELDCFIAPDTHVFAFKGLWECNWLQSLEVGIDPAHASFLHRFFEDEPPGDESYGRQFRSASSESDLPMTKVMREHARPEIHVDQAVHGLHLTALRRISDTATHVRLTNLVFPQAFAIPLSDEMTITQFHVPVDDFNNYWYAFFTSFGAPVDKALMREQRIRQHELPEYRPRAGRGNQYGFDAREQMDQTYTGMGNDINVHDQWACESQGPIQDRTREHLGTTDKAIMACRRMLIKAIDTVEQGGTPPMCLDPEQAATVRGPVIMDGIGPGGTAEALREFGRGIDARRRARAGWNASLPAATEPER
jgi:phenylpropionate dioxygenase-like ring-hydroxylating dioxygenase large terminal subunit